MAQNLNAVDPHKVHPRGLFRSLGSGTGNATGRPFTRPPVSMTAADSDAGGTTCLFLDFGRCIGKDLSGLRPTALSREMRAFVSLSKQDQAK